MKPIAGLAIIVCILALLGGVMVFGFFLAALLSPLLGFFFS